MEERADVLRAMKICRFCLDDSGPMRNIYERDSRGKQQNSVPLPLQIMACVAIEIFPNDGMPQMICNKCRNQTVQAYKFKTTCKKADDALKLYLATGNLIKPEIVEENHHEIKEEEGSNKKVINVKKRTIQMDSSSEPPKRQRTTVVIENNMMEEQEIILHHIDENTFTLDENGQEVVEAVHNITFEEAECHSNEEDDEMGDDDGGGGGGGDYVDDEDDVTHPTLKVSQVKTDVFPCERCERSFPLKQLLDIHMQNHNRERKFGCDECGRKFFSKYDLGKHFLVHTGDKPYRCSACGKAFSRESLLHRHEKIHVEVPKYLCTQCDRTFLTRDDLDSHSEKHKKRRPFQCKLCNKSFVFKQGLERHEVTHTDAAAHKCNYCEASFSTPGKLARHITSHAGIRPYPCKVCSRTFLLSHHLTRHMRNSHGANYVQPRSEVGGAGGGAGANGQFKCDVCSMSFRRKDSLINHTAIHSMVNLKCVICNTSFANAKLVKDHITSHLTGLPYTCDKCEYSFETQRQLEEHEVKHVQYVNAAEDERAHDDEDDRLDDEDDDNEDDHSPEEEYEPDEYIVPDERPAKSEFVRKSSRSKTIKNYAQFLKDELGSDSDSNPGDGEDDTDPDIVLPAKQPPSSIATETIKPVVRSEGTKVYQRKGKATDSPKRQPQAHHQQQQQQQLILNTLNANMASDAEITQPVSLEHLGLSQQTVNDMPNKRYIDMKIGEKIVRVKKLMMTKAEIEAMAKQGKIAMKGNTLLLKNDQLNALSKPSQSAAVRQSSPAAKTAQSPKGSPVAGAATSHQSVTTSAVTATTESSTSTLLAVAAPPQASKPSFKPISIETIINSQPAKVAAPKPATKKTYVKKPTTCALDEEGLKEAAAARTAAANQKMLSVVKLETKADGKLDGLGIDLPAVEKVVVENADTVEGQNFAS